MMNSQNIRKLVTTALIIALAIVFQQLRFVLGGSNIVSTYIISSLVNLCLIVAATAVGLFSGVAVSAITPLIALLQGHATLPMVPWIIAGNAVLAILYALFAQKDKASLAIVWPRWATVGVTAALIKFAVIALGQATVLTSAKGLAFQAALSTAAAAQVVQAITAGIAMILGGIILPMLPKKVVGKVS
ncbi:MAG: hypothetical protein ABIK64_03950 [Bacillota bacterium]